MAYDEDKEMLEQEKSNLEARLEYLDDPEQVKNDMLDKINSAISRRFPDYDPVHPENITMYKHLHNLKDRVESDWENLVAEQKERAEDRLEVVKSKLNDV